MIRSTGDKASSCFRLFRIRNVKGKLVYKTRENKKEDPGATATHN
jgi:hypothetical protein